MNARQLQLDYHEANKQNFDLNHVEITKTSFDQNKKSLTKKTTGKFYTPLEIGKPLVEALAKYILSLNKRKVSIIDPFCGDGRLIVWLLEKIDSPNLHVDISLWDYDDVAIKDAEKNVLSILKKLKLSYTIKKKRVDTFKEFYKDTYEEGFDVVVTNPPWDIVKPDKTELSHLDQLAKENYISSLKQFSNRLLNDYPLSKPNQMYAGWGVNLARIGTEVAIRLAAKQGFIGIVSPASLLADQNSVALREWLFENHHCKEVNYFPAESRLFEGVDLASISLIIIKSTQQNGILLTSFDKRAKIASQEKLSISTNFLKSIDYKLPISFGFKSTNLKQLEKLQSLPYFQGLESPELGGLWSGRELDETNHKSWLSPTGTHLFVKGRMVDRFTYSTKPNTFVSESKKSEVPKSANYHRLAWRDVSRPTQKRRIIATIIPPGWVAGNSLGVAYFKQDINNSKLFALLGVISSLIFEFQVRALLATSHISVGVLRKTHIPSFSDSQFVETVSQLVQKRLQGQEGTELAIEILVAKSYGFTRDDFENIIDAFPKIDDIYKEDLLNSRSWSSI